MAAGKEAPPYDHPHVQSSATFLECLLDDLFFLSIKLIPQMSLSLAENEIDLGRPPSDSHLLCKQCFLPPRRLPALSFPVAGILSFFVFFVSPSLLSSPAAALIQLSNIEFPVRQLSSSTLSPPQKSTTAVSDDVTRCIPELLADLRTTPFRLIYILLAYFGVPQIHRCRYNSAVPVLGELYRRWIRARPAAFDSRSSIPGDG
nr:hypothetical protein Iba_scaffold13986CG0020 [Ipomoea batatas]GME13816.1 hypothetical protein Iba_scaffold14736CG0010 [Ipomoea batatas]